jgi:hypothetical protein
MPILATILYLAFAPGQDPAPRPMVRVFLLAGQSNMEGRAVVDLDQLARE